MNSTKRLRHILLTVVLVLNNILFSQEYEWDHNFGIQGVKKIILEGRNTRGQKTIILDDGSIIVAVNSEIPRFGALFERDFYIYKLDSNGNVDLSFGINGAYHQEFYGNNQNVTYFFSMAYSHYKNTIYVLAKINGENKLFRINTDGILDTSFGINGYLALNSIYTRIAIQDDGKIVLTGFDIHQPNIDYKIIRLLVNGSIDPSFGINGEVILNPTPYNNDFINQVQIQTDGKIVTVGYSYTGNDGTSKAVITRFNSDGSLDSTFGNGGINITNLGSQNTGKFYDLDINENGDIIAAGNTYHTGGTGGWYGGKAVLVKYKYNGSLDMSFADNGIKVFDPIFTGANDTFKSVIFIDNDKIIAGGSSGSLFPSLQSYYYLRMVNDIGISNPIFFHSGFLITNFEDSITNYVFDINKNNQGDIISTGISKDHTDIFFQAVVCKITPTPTSITEFYEEGNFKLFPNPVNNKMIIKNDCKIKEIKIYSTNGKILYDNKLKNLSDNLYISVNLPKGEYIIEVVDENNLRLMKKFIKK